MLYRFGRFLLDLDRYELRAGERRVDVQPRPFALLVYLVSQAPRTVPKDELLARVWADAHTTEGVLTQAVSQLRRALDVVEGGAAVVETVRGRGYRISVPVVAEGSEAQRLSAPTPARFQRGGVLAVAAAVLLAIATVRLALPPDATETTSPSLGPTSLNPRAIAVLPFEDSSDDDGLLGQAVAEEIMTSLSRSRRVSVVARSSAFRFAGVDADLPTIGRELGVAHVLEGSVRRNESGLRVTARLVDVETGLSRWSEAWEGGTGDLVAMHRRIANEVLQRLAGSPGGDPPRSDRPGPRNFRAYDAYLRGMAALRLRDEESLRRAVRHFEASLAHDPHYAEGWAGLAAALGEQWAHFAEEPRNGSLMTRAYAAARHALELDPECAEAMRLLASQRVAQGDWPGARALLERALELEPDSVEVMLTLGAHLLRRGAMEEAISLLETAVRTDPFSATANLQLGRALYYSGSPDRAVAHLERSVHLNPDYRPAAAQLSLVYRELDRKAESRETFLGLLPPLARPLGRLVARVAGPDALLRVLVRLERLRTRDECGGDPEVASHLLAVVGDADRMFRCLRREVLARHAWYLAVHPVFDPYRDDPRFDALLEAAGMERIEISARRLAVDG